MKKSIFEIIFTMFDRIKSKLFTLAISPCFNDIGCKVSIIPPFRFHNLQFVKIGMDVTIHQAVFLNVMGNIDNNNQLKVIIGNHVSIGMNSSISCAQKIMIEDWVLIGRNVYISDHSHGFREVNVPIRLQDICKIKDVVIGSETWIGNNVIILPGVKIGKHCVIGANSVVNCSIPDFSVVAGSPAKIIRRFDEISKSWVKIIYD